MNYIVLDEAKHEYRTAEGRHVLGTTEILRRTGLVDQRWFDENSAWRGSVVHKCIELYNAGDLDESSVAPEAAPYLEAYKQFLKDSHAVVEFSERPFYSAIHDFAGRPDLGVRLSPPAATSLIDVKTGDTVPKATGLQLIGYAILYMEVERFVLWPRRYALRLRDNGHYTLDEYKDLHDRDKFFAALLVAKTQMEFGLNEF